MFSFVLRFFHSFPIAHIFVAGLCTVAHHTHSRVLPTYRRIAFASPYLSPFTHHPYVPRFPFSVFPPVSRLLPPAPPSSRLSVSLSSSAFRRTTTFILILLRPRPLHSLLLFNIIIGLADAPPSRQAPKPHRPSGGCSSRTAWPVARSRTSRGRMWIWMGGRKVGFFSDFF